MARRRGSIVPRGPNTWLVRVYVDRDPSTGRRRYRNATVYGTEAQAEQRLTELKLEVDASLGRSTAPVVTPPRRRWLAPIVRRAQPALGPLVASAAAVAAPMGALAVAAAAGVVGAALAVLQQAGVERFLDAFEERMVGYVGQAVDEKWAEGLSEEGAQTLLQAMARAHMIVGRKKLAAIASLAAGACVLPVGTTMTSPAELLDKAFQLTEAETVAFAVVARLVAHPPTRFVPAPEGCVPTLQVAQVLGRDDTGYVRLNRLEALALVYRIGIRGPGIDVPEVEHCALTDEGSALLKLAECGGWFVDG